MNKDRWKHVGRLLILDLAICLPMAWLEAKYWLDEPRSTGEIVGKGVFMAVFFTVLFGLLFRPRRKAATSNDKSN